jgi:hypothetical protein
MTFAMAAGCGPPPAPAGENRSWLEGGDQEGPAAGIEVAAGAIHGIITVAGSGPPEPVVGAFVHLPGAGVATYSEADGSYLLTGAPPGRHDVSVRAEPCLRGQIRRVEVSGQPLDFALAPRGDAFGYTCRDGWEGGFVRADGPLPLSGDTGAATVALPFDFPFYGRSYSRAHVGTNGVIAFGAPSTEARNTRLPSAATPNAAIYAFWDDLSLRSDSSVRTATLGVAPDRRFVVEWRAVGFRSYQFAGARITAGAILHESGAISLQYTDLSGNTDPNARDDHRAEQGGFATIGIEDAQGATAWSYSVNRRVLSPGRIIRFLPPARGD